MRAIVMLTVFCLFFALPASIQAKPWLAYVVRVEDGNTVVVSKSEDLSGKKYVLGFYGVDAPTLRQPFGEEACAYLRTLMPRGEQISVESVMRDKQGVIQAMIKARGVSLNFKLVEEGLAWVNRQKCRASFCRRWYIQEHKAVTERRNIWGINVSTPPWQWSH